MAITDTHADYRVRLPQWMRCRDVMEGSDAVKLRGKHYLPTLNGQTPEEYENYKCRANFFNGTARTRAALTGSVSAKDPAIKLPDAVRERLAPHLADITDDGTPLNDLTVKALDEVLTVGRCGLLVDMHDETVDQAERRAYWVLYEAEKVINWRVEKRGGGYCLTLVVLKECIDEAVADGFATRTIEQYRALQLNAAGEYQVTVYREDDSKTLKAVSSVIPTRLGTPLDFIPFTFVNPTSITPAVEKPVLLDMVDVNLSHYRTSADYEHGLHFIGLPTPWAVGLPSDQKTIPIGPTTVWKLSGANAAAGLLEFKGEGLGELRTALASKAEQMAVLGARLIEQPVARNETAEAIRTRNASTYATLRTVVNAVSQACTLALRWHVWWSGFGNVPADAVSVELNREFIDVDVSADELKSLVLAYQAGAMSFDVFFWNLQRGNRVPPNRTAADEQYALSHKPTAL